MRKAFGIISLICLLVFWSNEVSMWDIPLPAPILQISIIVFFFFIPLIYLILTRFGFGKPKEVQKYKVLTSIVGLATFLGALFVIFTIIFIEDHDFKNYSNSSIHEWYRTSVPAIIGSIFMLLYMPYESRLKSKVNSFISIMSFGYYDTKWRRLFRVVFLIILFLYHFLEIFKHSTYRKEEITTLFQYLIEVKYWDPLIVLFLPFAIVFLISWVLKPFVIKDEVNS